MRAPYRFSWTCPKKTPSAGIAVAGGLSLALMLAVALTGCGSATPTQLPAVPPPTVTPVPATATATATPPATPTAAPTATAIPATATPVPPTPTATATGTRAPALELEEEPYRNRPAGYAVQHPAGWVHTDVNGIVVFSANEEILADASSGGDVPSIPVVLIEAGALDDILYGEAADAAGAADLLEVALLDISGYWEDFQASDPARVTVGGEPAVSAAMNWSMEGVAAGGHAVAIHLGDRGVVIRTIGTAESWEQFSATLDAMLESMTFLAPVSEFQSDDGGYALHYPAGWQTLEHGPRAAFYESEAVMAEISGGAPPSVPIIVVEGGPVDGLADGEVAGAEDAWEMIEAIAAARGEEGIHFSMAEIQEIAVRGATGAWVDIHWEQQSDEMAGRAVAFRLGSWGLVVQSAGLEATWEPFVPTFEALVESLVFLGPFEEVIWDIGGESGSEPGEFSAIGGMDIGPNGNLFVADNLGRIQVISAEGNVLYSFGEEVLCNASDVKVAVDGTAFVADWGNHAVAAFTFEGEMWHWGSAGTGEGEFGDFSPQYLAVCPDGRVYVADSNEDAFGADYERVQLFDAQGGYLDQWNISEIDDVFMVSGMDCGADGNLYLVGFIGGYVMVLDPAGNLLAALGEDALAYSASSSLAIGPAGNIFVGTWNEGVLLLDPLGDLLGRWGTSTDEDGTRSEGQLRYADGLAVDAQGNIYVGDWAGGHSYVVKSMFP